MSSDYDIEMNSDETLELDTIIQESSIASDPISDVTYYGNNSYTKNILDEFETHTTVFNPPESGEYDINVNGQVLSINVRDTSAIPDSAIARYQLNGDYSDAIGNRDGTKDGTTFNGSGKEGDDSALFDGTDAHINVPNNFGIFDGSHNFTVMAWTRSSNRTGDVNAIFLPQGEYNWVMDLAGFRNDTTRFRFYDGSSGYQCEGNNLLDGTWHHLAFRWDSANGNGELIEDGSQVNSFSSSATPRSENGNNAIGAKDRNGVTFVQDGSIDDVIICDGYVNDADIQSYIDAV